MENAPSLLTAPRAACTNHPQRDAIGVCVKCRSRVCAECSTKVDGINYCVTCLASLATPAPGARESGPSSEWFGIVAALTLGSTFVALTWALLEVALPS